MNARRSADRSGARLSLGGSTVPENTERKSPFRYEVRPMGCNCARCVVIRASQTGEPQFYDSARYSGEEDTKMIVPPPLRVEKESVWSVLLDATIMLLALALALWAIAMVGR